LAGGLKSELLALAIVPPGGIDTLPELSRDTLRGHLQLAEDLGATIHLLATDDPVETVAALARAENVITLVLGHTPATSWRRFRTPLADRLLQQLDNVTLHLVGIRDESP
jgi:K+-sensing histidine kinase KdpD